MPNIPKEAVDGKGYKGYPIDHNIDRSKPSPHDDKKGHVTKRTTNPEKERDRFKKTDGTTG